MTFTDSNSNAYRTISTSIVLSLLLIIGLSITWRFIPSIILALILAVSTWPIFNWVCVRLNGRRTQAALMMTAGLVLAFVVPAYILSENLVANFSQFGRETISFFNATPQTPPSWLHDLPYVGTYADRLWTDYVVNSIYTVEAIKSNLDLISHSLLEAGAAVGKGVADLALAIFIAFFCFRDGTSSLQGLELLMDKYLGYRARHLMDICRTTTLGIVYGLVGTAVVQAVLAGFGFWVAGVPGAVFLALVTFLISPLPIGAPAIWIPASIWLLSQHHTGMAIFVFLWGLLVVSAIDNFVRPYLISEGSRMPLLVVFLGALGGVLSFGFIGFFIGPTILAIIYVLLLEEIRSSRPNVARGPE